MIAALKLLATIVAVKLWGGDGSRGKGESFHLFTSYLEFIQNFPSYPLRSPYLSQLLIEVAPILIAESISLNVIFSPYPFQIQLQVSEFKLLGQFH